MDLTFGQAANGIASAFTAVAGLMFVTSYALSARWWKSFEGRLMLMLGSAISGTYLLTVSLTLGGFEIRIDWLRIIQAGLTVSVGICFIYYTVLVWRLQRRNNRGNNKENI